MDTRILIENEKGIILDTRCAGYLVATLGENGQLQWSSGGVVNLLAAIGICRTMEVTIISQLATHFQMGQQESHG